MRNNLGSFFYKFSQKQQTWVEIVIEEKIRDRICQILYKTIWTFRPHL